jgi:uncharacterized protein
LPDGPLSPAKDGVHVRIRVQPRARQERVVGLVEAAGGCVLKAAVTAPAEAGRANEALLALLAREWTIPRRDLAIVAGHKSRSKIVQIAGDPEALVARLAAILAPSAGALRR